VQGVEKGGRGYHQKEEEIEKKRRNVNIVGREKNEALQIQADVLLYNGSRCERGIERK